MKRAFIVILIALVLAGISGCKISGTITENGKGIAGVTVVLSGGSDMTAVTDSNGYYGFSFDRKDSSENSYTIRPSKEGCLLDGALQRLLFQQSQGYAPKGGM